MSSKTQQPSLVLSSFMADEVVRNKWLKCKRIEVYVRKGPHFLKRGAVHLCRPCLQVANWNTRGPGTPPPHKHFSQSQLRELIFFMREVERAVVRDGYTGVFVENVFNEALRRHLHKHGYAVVSGKASKCPCFFKSTASILTRSKDWVQDLQKRIHSIQRPTISSFSADATLSRFWVRDQATKLQIFLKRECTGIYPAQKHRITILNVLRESIDSTQCFDHQIYLDDDYNELKHLLQRIKNCFRGLTEIAISREAVWCWSNDRFASRTDYRWLIESGFLLECNQSLRGVADKFVKRVD